MYFDPKNWKMYLLYDWWICIAFVVFIFFIVKYHWSRRWLYYYASKFEGPFSLPLIGNAHYFLGPYEDVIGKGLKLANDYSSGIFRLWIGKDLYIFNSRPEHVEIILNKCLDKSPIYEIITGNVVNDSLLVSPVNQWKKNRKLIIPTFNPTIIKSFQNTFATNSKILLDRLEDKCQKELDIFPIIWRTTFEITSETLFDMDKISIDNPEEAISQLIRWEKINTKRIIKPWLHPTVCWKVSSLYKESEILFSELRNVTSKIMQMKKSQYINDEDKELRFLNYLITNETKLTEKELFEEFLIMLVASTETTSISQSFVLLVLGIIPEIQQKIYEELYNIFGDSQRDATWEDLNRMDYLERVIKETMRLFPPFLIIARFVDSDLKIDKYVFPKGSNIVIPIVHIHRTQTLWKNPLKFDPDRFLPEEVTRRHRCAYLPFSVGPRNCPGIQYGMTSMKTILSTLIRRYKVISCNYQSLEEIKMVFNLVTKPHKDFKVVLEKRV